MDSLIDAYQEFCDLFGSAVPTWTREQLADYFGGLDWYAPYTMNQVHAAYETAIGDPGHLALTERTYTEACDLASSNLFAFGYDHQNATLTMRFHSGAIYVYDQVTEAEFAGLLHADSFGKYFVNVIRNTHPWTKLAISGG